MTPLRHPGPDPGSRIQKASSSSLYGDGRLKGTATGGPAYPEEQVRVLDILWNAVEKEAHDRGSYLVILKLPRKRLVHVGGLGDFHLQKGFLHLRGRGLSDH